MAPLQYVVAHWCFTSKQTKPYQYILNLLLLQNNTTYILPNRSPLLARRRILGLGFLGSHVVGGGRVSFRIAAAAAIDVVIIVKPIQSPTGQIVGLARRESIEGFPALHGPFNGIRQDLVALGDEGRDLGLATAVGDPARRAATAVQVIERIEGKIKHDDVIDGGDIETSCWKMCEIKSCAKVSNVRMYVCVYVCIH